MSLGVVYDGECYRCLRLTLVVVSVSVTFYQSSKDKTNKRQDKTTCSCALWSKPSARYRLARRCSRAALRSSPLTALEAASSAYAAASSRLSGAPTEKCKKRSPCMLARAQVQQEMACVHRCVRGRHHVSGHWVPSSQLINPKRGVRGPFVRALRAVMMRQRFIQHVSTPSSDKHDIIWQAHLPERARAIIRQAEPRRPQDGLRAEGLETPRSGLGLRV